MVTVTTTANTLAQQASHPPGPVLSTLGITPAAPEGTCQCDAHFTEEQRETSISSLGIWGHLPCASLKAHP